MILGIHGSTGHMGRVMAELYASEEPDTHILGFHTGRPLAEHEGPPLDVIIDFSHRDALPEVLDYCRSHGTPLVLATTGFDPEAVTQIHEAAASFPLFQSANLSLGIHALRALVREAARLLGEDADIEIIERHHRRKLDGPSGTALLLLEEASRGVDPKVVHGRSGQAPRTPGEIGIHAVRGGTIVGEHTVLFALNGETIELTHRGESRALFARGAMKAASFIRHQAPGLYGMADLFRPEDES